MKNTDTYRFWHFQTFTILTFSDSDAFRFLHFQILTLSDSDAFRSWHFQILTHSDSDTIRFLHTQILTLSDLGYLGQKILTLQPSCFIWYYMTIMVKIQTSANWKTPPLTDSDTFRLLQFWRFQSLTLQILTLSVSYTFRFFHLQILTL